MNRTSLLQDLLSTIADRRSWLPEALVGSGPKKIEDICSALMSTRGEASGTALAAQALATFSALDDAGRLAFFENLVEHYDPNPGQALTAAQSYARDRSAESLAALIKATEPPRQELLRRLNQAPGGTAALVQMREYLLKHLKDHQHLKRLDADFLHMFSSWFNRGFLVMQPIDWRTPAHILEKIIDYEAVHEIGDWNELRSRLRPADRRCFAFFHPSVPDEPLVFVEVALTAEIPVSIQDLLTEDRQILPIEKASTAVFYSISNCQAGLRGVSFGNFLIKQVAEDLRRAAPSIKTFVTLSPAPGFMDYLQRRGADKPKSAIATLVKRIAAPDWSRDAKAADSLKKPLLSAAAHYFLNARRADRQPVDPVARFHLGNGAQLHQINWLADTSPKGLAQSAGIMVNYLYDLDRIELNHEAYAKDREITASRRVRALLPSAEEQQTA